MNLWFALVFAALFGVSSEVLGAGVFRDIEIENVVKKISAPLFAAANVDIKAVKVFVVDDNSVNAYVSPSNHIFIHKGLLKFSKDPSPMAGVIAHEIGHMSQHHVVKREGERMKEVMAGSLSYVLGLVTSIVLDPRIGNAIMSSGSAMSQRRFLAYSRIQEDIADQYGLEYLDSAGYSTSGLLEVLRYFNKLEAQHVYIDEYLSSHPMSEQRLRKIYSYRSRRAPTGFSEEDKQRFSRVVEKTEAFLMPLNALKDRNLSLYMQAIVDYREANLKQALDKLEMLIGSAPRDPYLREIRAQVYYKLGAIDAAIADYEVALYELSNNSLMKLLFAEALAFKDPQRALKYLEEVLLEEKDNPYVWRQLAAVYGRMGKVDMVYFALANRYYLERDNRMFLKYVRLAKQSLEGDSVRLLLIRDLEEANGYL